MTSGSKTLELRSLEVRLTNPGREGRLEHAVRKRVRTSALLLGTNLAAWAPLLGGGSYTRMPRPLSFPVSRGSRATQRLGRDPSLLSKGRLG